MRAIRRDSSIKNAAAFVNWIWQKGISEKSREKILKNPSIELDKLKYKVSKKKAAKTRRITIKRKGPIMAKNKGRSRRRRMSGEVAYYGGRKARRRRNRRMSGEVAYYGGNIGPESYPFAGRKSRRSRRMSGGFRLGKMDMVTPAINTALSIGGGIGGRIVKNALPFEDERIKAAIPVLLGIVLSMMGAKNRMIANMGAGMAAIGGADLLSLLFPKVELFQGEQAAQVGYTAQDVQEALNQGMITQDEANVLTQAGGYMGLVEDYSGQDRGEIGPEIPEGAIMEQADGTWETTDSVL